MSELVDEQGFLAIEDGHELELSDDDGLPPSWHVFSSDEVNAINAALAIGRPLLVRGEPGTGKSQLARAAAVALGRPLVHQTVDRRTETRDLLYVFDAIARLAEAQVMSTRKGITDAQVAERLEPGQFVRPGALWWALDWKDAHHRCTGGRHGPCSRSSDAAAADGGVVVLIDEIDKADPSVPNGLLDALAHQSFNVDGVKRVSRFVGKDSGCGTTQAAPVVIITTNEERTLPAAFLRRCLVLHLALPTDRAGLIDRLCARGAVHCPDIEEDVLKEAAGLLVDDRAAVVKRGLSPPGLSEYLDLIKVLKACRPGDPEGQSALLEDVSQFALQKHPPVPKTMA